MAKQVITIEGEWERKAFAYGVPMDGAGELIVRLPLAWAWVCGRLQVVIDLPGVRYPQMVPATRAELLALMADEEGVA